MNFVKISKYDNCDILRGWNCNNVQSNGFDKNKSLGEMIDMALNNNCKIIIKSGYNGKWYLKGQGKSINYLKIKINQNIGRFHDGVTCYLVE